MDLPTKKKSDHALKTAKLAVAPLMQRMMNGGFGVHEMVANGWLLGVQQTSDEAAKILEE